MQNCVVWKGKIWVRAGALLFGFHFSPFPSCQITFSVSLLKWQFLTLRSSHSSKGYPFFCLELSGFFSTSLLACVRSSELLHSLLCSRNTSISMFTEHISMHGTWYSLNTHTDTQEEECCLDRHVTHGQESPNIVIRPCSEKVASYHWLYEDIPADTTNLLCKKECKIPVLHAMTSKNLFLSSRSEDEPLINYKFWKEVAQYHTLEQLDDILNCQEHAIELTFVQYFRLEEDLKDHLVQHVLVKTWSRKDGPASCPMKGTVKGICSRLIPSTLGRCGIHLRYVYDTAVLQ